MNHVENRFHAKNSPDTLRLGLVFRRLRNDKLKHVATARPLYLRGAERVFRSAGSSDTLSPYETLPGIDSRSPSPWSADPRSGQPGCKPFLRAPVGSSNTETDDDCRPATFHRGRFRCEAPFSTQQ